MEIAHLARTEGINNYIVSKKRDEANIATKKENKK